MSIELSDIRCFIKDIKQVFTESEENEEMDNVMRYSMIKVIVSLRIEESKLIKTLLNKKK